jgi:LysM repeat protein
VSSLRPLVTILLLAAVGVVLYLKINEGEPAIPSGVGDWTAGPLDIGGGTPTSDVGATTLPPDYAADGAPAFTPGTAATGASPPATGDVAPSWSPGPLAVSDPAPSTAGASTAGADSSPVARTAEPEVELPAMPPLPGAAADEKASTTPSPSASAETDAAPFTPPLASAPSATNLEAPKQASESKPAAAIAAAAAASGATPPAPVAADPITPTGSTAEAASPAPASLFPSVRVAVQAELERGELSQALLRLSDWYGDPSLTPAERQEVDTLLSQLAGSVIWEGPPAHRLEPAYVTKAGEKLQDVGKKYDVPWELLARINGVANPEALQPGQELKVVRGPFSALVDLSERTMTLMLDRRYAGKFAIELDPTTAIEEGQWKVDQKLLTPAAGGLYGQASGATEDRSLLLANPANPTAQSAVLRGPGSDDPASPQPPGRVIRLKSTDVNDVYDILSVGSRVTIRR